MSQSVTGIPSDQVGTVVQDFVDEGSTTIVVEQQADGTFTVSATA